MFDADEADQSDIKKQPDQIIRSFLVSFLLQKCTSIDELEYSNHELDDAGKKVA